MRALVSQARSLVALRPLMRAQCSSLAPRSPLRSSLAPAIAVARLSLRSPHRHCGRRPSGRRRRGYGSPPCANLRMASPSALAVAALAGVAARFHLVLVVVVVVAAFAFRDGRATRASPQGGADGAATEKKQMPPTPLLFLSRIGLRQSTHRKSRLAVCHAQTSFALSHARYRNRGNRSKFAGRLPWCVRSLPRIAWPRG